MTEQSHHHVETPHDIPLKFRDYFLTGLTVILPLWLTVYIVWGLVNLLGNLLFPIVRPFLRRLLQQPPPEPLLIALASVIVFFLIWGLGYLVVHVIGHGHIERIESLIARIPFVRSVHGIIKRMLEVFLAAKGKFRQVVLIEFPIPGHLTLGFVTREEPLESEENGERLVPVLIPTAPNPASGFLVFVPEKSVRYVDITTDEAMTLLVSAGTFGPSSMPSRRA